MIILPNHRWEAHKTGTAPCPTETPGSVDYEIWQQIESLALSQLAMNMDLTLYGEISTDDMTSAQLWNAINQRFEEHSELAAGYSAGKTPGESST